MQAWYKTKKELINGSKIIKFGTEPYGQKHGHGTPLLCH